MPFRELNSIADLPRPGSFESPTLDFKAAHSTNDLFERAKDMAAFANHIGGTILVGAAEVGGELTLYRPLSSGDATNARRDYENAARDLCSSRPIVTCIAIEHLGGTVLAVNVRPHVDRLVGVRRSGDIEFWSFPLRVGSQTIYLTPEQLPMYADPRTRRALLLVESVPRGEPVLVWTLPGPGSARSAFRGEIESISETNNAVQFVKYPTPAHGTRVNTTATFALDQLRTVFKDKDVWTLCFDALQ